MDTRSGNKYDMLRRVREFGAAHADSFPAGSVGAQLFAQVGDAVTTVTSITTSEGAGHSAQRDSATTKAVARGVLEDALAAVKETARAMAATTPGLEDRFKPPSTRSGKDLLVAARTFVLDATPLEAEFVARNMPATFLADLQTAIDAFEQASTAQSNANLGHVGARAGLYKAIAAAVAAVRQLGPIVRNTFRHDANVLAVWHAARRISPAPAARRAAAGPAAVPPAPVSPAVAAAATPAAVTPAAATPAAAAAIPAKAAA